jgi:hypothetical protein
MKDTIYKTKLSTGLEFEAEMVQVIGEYCASKKKNVELSRRDFRVSTADEDRNQGTDCYVFDVPVDFTLAIEGKDHMILDKETMVIDGYEVKFGFRTGNIHRDRKSVV